MMKLDETTSVSDGFVNMHFDEVTEMLTQAYWSVGITQNEVVKGAENSALVVGVFCQEVQVAYARVISDKTRFAYVTDVYVDEKHRKKGLGKAMVHYILNHPELSDVYQWALYTSDAHKIYKKCGFKKLKTPESWMEIRKNRPKKRKF